MRSPDAPIAESGACIPRIPLCSIRATVLIHLCLLLAGCASIPWPECTQLPGVGRYCLQDGAGTPAFAGLQQVDVRMPDRRETLLVSLENDADGLRLAALTPFGQTLVQLEVADGRLRSVPEAAALPFDPAWLAAAVQLALWPAAAVERGLEAGLHVMDSAYERRIYTADGNLIEIAYEGDAPPYRRVRVEAPGARMAVEVSELPETNPARP